MRFYIISIIAIISIGHSQPINHFYFINPGVKVGYAFGENGGFTYGFELSYVRTGPTWLEKKYGVVLNVDWIKDLTKYHLGVEYIGGALLGGEFGPSILIQNGEIDYGVQATPFLLFFLIPYYSHTFVLNGIDINEIGSFVKLPFQIEPNKDNGVFPLHD